MNYLQVLLGDSYKEGLTHEEIGALVKAKMEALQSEADAFKNASTKNASEAASWKQKYNNTLSDAEKEKAKYEDIVKRNEELEKNSKIADNYAKFIALGYDKSLAKDTAEALVNGEVDKVFANQKTYQDKVKADYDAKLLQKTPTPPPGQPTKITKEQFNKMSYAEMCKVQVEDPTTYAELIKK